jgi:hypothetical protein
VQGQGSGRPPGVVIVRTRNTGTSIIFGFLTALWVVALIASESAQPTVSGRISAGVVFGVFLVATVAGWLSAGRRRRQLEVGRDAIVDRPAGKGKQPFTLTRGEGDTLRILPQFKLYGKVRQPRLIFLGRGGFITLPRFRLEEVRRACETQGWRFDGDPSQAVRDVQSCLHRGQSVEAVQLLELFGPFPAAPADGEPDTALAAAVFEDVGDKLVRASRANARDAYQRAASAQRAFAGYAQSAAEGGARLSAASRIDGKVPA